MQNNIIELIKKELSLDELSPEEIENVVSDLGGKITQNILLNFTASLTDQEILEWDKVLQTDDQEKVNKFIMDHSGDLEELVVRSSKEIIQAFKDGMVD